MSEPRVILYIEQEGDDVLFLRHALKRAGLPHKVIDRPDAAQALEYLEGKPPFDNRADHPLPHLIVTTYQPESEDQRRFLAWIRARPHLQIPVIVLSSFYGMPEKIEECRQHGFAECYDQPATIEDLERLVWEWEIKFLTQERQSRAA